MTLGGDGSILRAVELLDGAAVPILGVDHGQLGYLTEVEPGEAEGAVARILAGEHELDERMLVEIVIRSGDSEQRHFALNEAVVERSADVTLKERRPLLLLVRETPLHVGHLRLMVQASEMGATVMPPLPAFYHQPQSLQDVVDHTVGKVMDLLGAAPESFPRWQGQ